MTSKKLIAVKYDGGEWDDYYVSLIFVTNNEQAALEYVDRFNAILAKWKAYYKQFEEIRWEGDEGWIAGQHRDKFCRWYGLRNIEKCFIDEIEFRPFHIELATTGYSHIENSVSLCHGSQKEATSIRLTVSEQAQENTGSSDQVAHSSR